MTNKPFDPNKPYRRRDRKPAKIVYITSDGKCVVSTRNNNGTEFVYITQRDGRYKNDYDYICYDLVNIPEKIEGWQNIFRTGLGSYVGGEIYNTEDLAKADSKMYVNWSYITCIKVSFTEGDGLSDD